MLAKKADGSETTEEWKEKAAATMSAIYGSNNERNALAHSHLEPAADGSVAFARLQNRSGVLKGKGEPNKWEQANFASKIAQLSELTKQLEQIKSDLVTAKILYPDLGWLNAVHRVYYQPPQPRNAALLDTVAPPLPTPPTEPQG